MSQQHIPYTLAHPQWYDVPWAPGSPLLREPLTCEVPDDWHRAHHGAWTVHLPPSQPIARQGWKVHVAVLPADAAHAADVAAAWCVEQLTPFKVLRGRGLVHATQLKYADPSSSGKVITCYPEAEQLEPFCRGLAARLAGIEGPQVLGELPVAASPLWLRHGSFISRWGQDASGSTVPVVDRDGRAVADRRGAVAAGTSDDEPAFIDDLRRQRLAAATQLPISDVTVLHRSNAGGVYRARWHDGRTVVLKEARPRAGLDAAGVDAATRLAHEYRVLQRLSGSGVAPEPVDHRSTPDGDFLVMAYLPHPTVIQCVARIHPLISRSSEALSPDAYLAWVDQVTGGLRTLADALASRGVAHKDLQPANVMVGPDGLLAIDFESASLDGVTVATGVGTPGLSRTADGQLSDHDAADRIATVLLHPTAAPVLAHRRDWADRLRRAALDDLGIAACQTVRLPQPPASAPRVSLGGARQQDAARPRASATTGRTGSFGHCADGATEDVPAAPTREHLLAGIAASATTTRDDRLFPGDPAQFAHPGAALGLLHGAVGVLSVVQHFIGTVNPDHVAWLRRVVERASVLPAGLADGAHGLAVAACRLGDVDLADLVVHRAQLGVEPLPTTPSLGTGSAGHAVSLHHLADALDRDDLHAASDQAWLAVADAVTSGSQPLASGLFTGWEGVGLALLASPLPDRRALAAMALQRALALTVVDGGTLLSRSDGAAWPYLGRGPLACGPLALALDATEHAEVINHTTAACRAHLVYSSGLLHGRAGLLMVLRHLTGDADPWLDDHVRRLGWYALPLPAADRRGTTPVAMLGDHGLRCSTDLATGSAGVLLAMGPAPWQTFMTLLGLRPHHDDCHVELVTPPTVAGV